MNNRRRSTGRILAFASCATLAGVAIFLAGCGDKGGASASSEGKPGEKITLGFIVKDEKDPWFQAEMKFAQEAATKYGFELATINADSSDKVASQIDLLNVKGAKGFVICSVDTKLGPAITTKAAGYNMKVVTVDDQLVADGKPMEDVPYVGIDAKKIGIGVGDALYAEMQKRGWKPEDTGLMAVTWEQLETTKLRTDGAIEALTAKGFPAAKIFKAPQAVADIDGANKVASTTLAQHPEVKHWLICGNNDIGVFGAVRATEAKNIKAEDVIGIGINGIGTEVQSELAKPLTGFFGSALLQPKKHGYNTAEMLYKWVTKNEKPKNELTDAIIITRENYKKMLSEQGLLGK